MSACRLEKVVSSGDVEKLWLSSFFSLSVSCSLSFALLPTSEHCCADQDVFFFFLFCFSKVVLSLSAQIMMFGIADDCFESRS